MLVCLENLQKETQVELKRIYKENRNRMYRIAFSVLNHHEDAENAVQDSFISLLENYGKYKELEPVKMVSLCNTIVRNKAIDILRRKINRSECELEETIQISEEEEVENIIVKQEEQEEVWEMLEQLDELTNKILVLKYFHGYKNADIADLLCISKRVVEMRLHRIKQKMREEFRKE